MDKYRAPDPESGALPNLLVLNDSAALGLTEFEGFLRADIVLTENLSPETRFTTQFIRQAHRLALGEV